MDGELIEIDTSKCPRCGGEEVHPTRMGYFYCFKKDCGALLWQIIDGKPVHLVKPKLPENDEHF